MDGNQEIQNRGIDKAEGITKAERYLAKLCEKTFLSLWSYPSVFRDQGRGGKGDGKEVCDLLVVFENHIIIFSDKDCQYPNTGNPELDWCRWYRKAVDASAAQVFGAERWIKEHPTKLYLDRLCTQPFPLILPNGADTKFHRIVVAHDASRRCREELGGSGSLMIAPEIIGAAHYQNKSQRVHKFAIGQVNQNKGFIHVLDDTTLEILLQTMDTISDFVQYLNKKVEFINKGQLRFASGEEELLAIYLTKLNNKKEHDFVFPGNFDAIAVEEGFWKDFETSSDRKKQLQANETSYTWDGLIEKFGHHIRKGTSYANSSPIFSEQVTPMKWLAREPRVRRRLLSDILIDAINRTVADRKSFRFARVVKPSNPGDPFYVFLLLKQPTSVEYDEYREMRRKLLEAYCMVVKLRCPEALDIVGIATEAGPHAGTSEDVLYLDARDWDSEAAGEARRLQVDLQLLQETIEIRGTEHEYPKADSISSKLAVKTYESTATSMRNSSCPCGSGRKFKKCCINRR